MTLKQQLVDGSDAPRVRFGEVDGLKGLAMFAIVAYQAARFAGLPAGTPDAVARLVRDGSQGLTLVLVLSAFALAYPPLAALRAGGTARLDLRGYAARRLLRVAPAYLVVVGVAAGLAPLAALFGLPVLAAGLPPFDFASLGRAALFSGDGFGNDGFRAVDLIVRSYVVFPVVLAVWIRFRAAAVALALGGAGLEIVTATHGWGAGALVPLVLGIAAADLRIRGARLGRFGVPLAVAALAAAWFSEPYVAQLAAVGAGWFAQPRLAQWAGALGASGDLRVDPLWALAAFGLLAAIGSSRALARVAGFAPLRLFGGASYGVSLVAMPACAFAGHQISAQFGPLVIALAGGGASLLFGFVVWQTVDRWFGYAGLRSAVAHRLAGFPDRRRFSADLGAGAGEPLAPAAPICPPATPTGPVAVLSTRSGSAADFAAEIVETKRRLSEAPAAFFAVPIETAAPKPPAESAMTTETAETPDAILRVASPRRIHLRIGPGTRPSAALTALHQTHA